MQPTARTTVLVVDDEPAFQETIARYLKGYRRLVAHNGWQAMDMLAKHQVHVVLLDLNLPDVPGLKLLAQLRAEREDVEILVVTSHSEIGNAVQAVKLGAFDFLAKTYENYVQIGTHIERALEHRRVRNASLVARMEDRFRESFALLERTQSEELSTALDTLRKVAATPLTVLLEGESGVGKELLTRLVHLQSDRSHRPLVTVNVGAIPPSLLESTLFGHEKGAFTGADKQRIGKFELADGGTLFLDEIGELGREAQVKILRVLQEREVERLGSVEPRPVDVRIIGATNKDLEAEVKAGRFREDLFFRLNVVRLRVPPLRQRRKDIPELVSHLAERAAKTLRREPPTFTQEALRALEAYPWPGNVRELENLVMRLTAFHPGGLIRFADIPIEYCVERLGTLARWHAERRRSEEASLYDLATKHFERYFVKHVVERCGGNMAEASRQLGVSYATVKNKMYALLAPDDDRPGSDD
ncbi:MAG: sigma-54-dependent Fis family transcriptional regulator [Deltaproteobacteria bacterium]|nr:sigma-54-dependent Fis family transcriptional regulator [Deltaproteobacteria bacterium]